jgi:hypothetical protein
MCIVRHTLLHQWDSGYHSVVKLSLREQLLNRGGSVHAVDTLVLEHGRIDAIRLLRFLLLVDDLHGQRARLTVGPSSYVVDLNIYVINNKVTYSNVAISFDQGLHLGNTRALEASHIATRTHCPRVDSAKAIKVVFGIEWLSCHAVLRDPKMHVESKCTTPWFCAQLKEGKGREILNFE